jgi:hypothetical protein
LVDLAQQAGIPCSSSSDSPTPQQQQQLPGQLLLPVVIWPCARLARGSALLSPGAWDSLAQPPSGSYLALYEQQFKAAAAPGALHRFCMSLSLLCNSAKLQCAAVSRLGAIRVLALCS